MGWVAEVVIKPVLLIRLPFKIKRLAFIGLYQIPIMLSIIKNNLFFYMKVSPTCWNQRAFVFRCGRSFCHECLYESLTNMLELKDFRFSLWQGFLPCMLYEKAASKATSAEPPPRWAIGTGQLSCLQFRSGPIARRGGGGIIPFSIFVVSVRTCPL